MNLKEYLEQNGIRAIDFARKLGVTPAYIYSIKSGKRTPGATLARQLVKYSDKQITLESLYAHKD